MTGRITTRAEWRSRVGQIAARYPMASNILRGGETVRSLWKLSYHSPTVCRQTLDLCQPFLHSSDWDPEDWLRLLYAHLSDSLFPEPGQMSIPFSDRENLYLAVLELVLDHRPEVFDPLLDLLPLEEGDITGSRVEEQYRRFLDQVRTDHVAALLTLGRELMPFDPASHTIGVHNVALHIGILAKRAGLDVDLPLVRAAAFGHDIGKFGCRGEDARRIPYLHYYYTWQWFRAHGMEEIGYISANHSTWDLEFENLPIESLLLIYADFRVRGVWNQDTGQERVSVHSLTDAYEAVFTKLYDMTPEKKRRYETVYYKLLDFQRFLESRGVPTDLQGNGLRQTHAANPALLFPEQALQALRNMTLSHSIRLMRMVSREESFTQLLEQTKREKSLPSIRTYLHLLEEYNTYLTVENKRKTLVLLYELLMHPEGDVRRKAGQIIGLILANSGPKYRKERPSASLDGVSPPAMMALLEEAVSLWRQYIEQCLHPDHKLSMKHAQRISNSLKTICGSLFAHCDEKDAGPMLRPLLEELLKAQGRDRFVLADALFQVPCGYLSEEDLSPVLDSLEAMLKEGDLPLQLAVLRCLGQFITERLETAERVREMSGLTPFHGEGALILNWSLSRILGLPAPETDRDTISELYLSNMKNAVPWMIKLAQIDMLTDDAIQHPDGAFLTGMHLSNLLSVSEHLPVREHAGECLLKLCPTLTVTQINEIAIDLLRELESGQEQISRFIPPYIGRILCILPEKECSEAVLQLESLIQGTSARPARAALYTLGEILSSTEDTKLSLKVLSILMTGVSHYEGTVHRTALTVLCREVFRNDRISLERKRAIFVLLHKKLLTILSEPVEDRLTFFSRAAMLNHLYRFIVQCQVETGGFLFPARKPAAFFPGTFDPFSVGHKRIVEEIRDRGYEVYLAVDEFSWSKRTLARRMRRRIVGMSIADQWDTYLFPDDIPVNLANPEDLDRLKELLGGNVYLVAGDDVIRNASAYRNGHAADFDHIVFLREGDREDDLREIIHGNLQILSLPSFYDTVSSTRIRAHVDQDLDISMLVTPMVQSYIYEYGLYVRSPEQKSVLRRQDMYFRNYRSGDPVLPEAMNWLLRVGNVSGTVLRVLPDILLGWAVGHTLQMTALYDTLHSLEAASYVRKHTSGRILMIDRVCIEGPPDQDNAICRMLLNELLARSLESDHTYALCRCQEKDSPLRYALEQLGFVPVAGQEDILYVDMRSPIMLLQDVFLQLKEPHRNSRTIKDVVATVRPRLRSALTGLFPGKLLLCFDSEMLNQSLMEQVRKLGGVSDTAARSERLSPCMCVPYGKILADEVVPNIATKALRVEKRFRPDLNSFEVVEYPGYSTLKTQVRTLRSFRRPVILVDDLLHKGYRIEKLDQIFKDEDLEIYRIVVAVMSGYGRDLMKVQNRQVDCEYFIPNLHYWFTESLLYPFIGGDSVGTPMPGGQYLPSINMILPYYYPNYLEDAEDDAVRALSRTALENSCALLKALEETHLHISGASLTIGHLSEALCQPRLPDRGRVGRYDFTMAPSAYLEDDLDLLERIVRKEGKHYDL